MIYLLLVALLITFFFFVGPQIARQAQRLSESLPKLLETVSSGQIAEQIGKEQGWSIHTRAQLSTLLANHRNDLLSLAQRAGLRVADVAKQAWLLIVVPILAAFFLKDGRAFGEVLLSFVHSRPQREFLEGVLGDLNQMLAQFIRAQLTLAAFSCVAYIAYLESTRVPYALVLGTAGGIMEFIPGCRTSGRCRRHLRCRPTDEVSPLVDAADFSCRVASRARLCDFTSDHGKEHGIASPGRDLWGSGGWGDRRRVRRVSLHFYHGQSAHRVAAVASIAEKRRFGAAE